MCVCVCVLQTSEHNAECELHSGVAIEVCEQAHDMRQVVNLIIALNRIKKWQKVQSTEFTDDELHNILFENLVEGNYQFWLRFQKMLNSGVMRQILQQKLSHVSRSAANAAPSALTALRLGSIIWAIVWGL